MARLVAVIDLGKSNKKVLLIDDALRIVDQRQAEFAARPGPDGILQEPVEAIWTWLGETLGALHKSSAFGAIAVSTHGATIACLDDEQQLAVPVVAYDHALDAERQADLDRRFYELCGQPGPLQDETGTCDLPLLINPAKALLFYRDRYPQGSARIRRILNYPQYWGWRLTGRVATEPTYAFNHSFLYDVRTRQPSTAARALGVAHALDRHFLRPWDRLGLVSAEVRRCTGLPELPVAVGIHDSNAALLPYLIKHSGTDFVLNSTGTWCVAMHAVRQVAYAPDELGRKIIFNIDALGGYQKTSFLMGGQEYGLYHELIGGTHVTFDRDLVDAALARIGEAIVPGAVPSQFPRVKGGAMEAGRLYTIEQLRARQRPPWFSDQVRAHYLLNVGLALQTEVALRAIGLAAGTAVFIEGGFRQNQTYCQTLAALLPENEVACTSLEQATATGTALLGHSLLSGGNPAALADRFRIERTSVSRPRLDHLAAYRQWYRQQFA